MSRYGEVYQRWTRDPEGFWAEAAQDVDWSKPWASVFQRIDGHDRWFAGAEANTCFNCLDRHVERGRGGQKALIYDSPVTAMKVSWTIAKAART